jgi:hypothetical protein
MAHNNNINTTKIVEDDKEQFKVRPFFPTINILDYHI